MARRGSNNQFATLMVLGVQIFLAVAASAQDCEFPNTTMVSPTACGHDDFRAMAAKMLACVSYLDEDDVAPSAKCCAGVRNVSTLSPPCLCKGVFFNHQGVAPNDTRGKVMPGLCNVTVDLCRVCSAFLVARAPHQASMADSEGAVSSYKKKVLALAVVLGLAMGCIIVVTVLVVRKKLKQRKALPAVAKAEFQSKPGCDY